MGYWVLGAGGGWYRVQGCRVPGTGSIRPVQGQYSQYRANKANIASIGQYSQYRASKASIRASKASIRASKASIRVPTVDLVSQQWIYGPNPFY